LLVGQVDFGDLVSCKEDAVLAVGRERSDGDALATEGLGHVPVLIPQGIEWAHALVACLLGLGSVSLRAELRGMNNRLDRI
jgi:hypothetical protein